jgi:haloalkane dehalogenase
MTINPQLASAMFREPPERFIDVGAGEVAYRKIGSGPDVLFIHGWPVSGATFRTLLPFMADRVTCHVIDLPGAGSSKFDDSTSLSLAGHIKAIATVIDALKLDRLSVVGHDSGGLVARHAMVGDSRVTSLGLINTEQSQGMTLRFRSFVLGRYVPGFGRAFGWVAGQPKIRRNRLALGAAFEDRSLLDGEFDEFFLRQLHTSRRHQVAALKVLRSFDTDLITQLRDVHHRITVPVKLVWGDRDPFFPVARAREMVATFPNASLTEIAGAGLFSHEEQPKQVAEALLPVLVNH